MEKKLADVQQPGRKAYQGLVPEQIEDNPKGRDGVEMNKLSSDASHAMLKVCFGERFAEMRQQATLKS